MIVCDRLRLLVTHAPKTGGSAVTKALLPWSRRRVPVDQVGARGWQLQVNVGRLHPPRVEPWARDLVRQGWTHAATIRDPWERVESFYAYWGELHPSFEEFCSSLPDRLGRGRRRHLRPATMMTEGVEVHHWLRNESLQDDLDALLGRVGVPLEDWPRLDRVNERPLGVERRELSSIYTPETIARVGRVYAGDVLVGGYEPPEIGHGARG